MRVIWKILHTHDSLRYNIQAKLPNEFLAFLTTIYFQVRKWMGQARRMGTVIRDEANCRVTAE